MRHVPQSINLQKQSQSLVVVFADKTYTLSAEYLRQFSPSAEVRGHGNSPRQFSAGKKDVQMTSIKPVGRYAIRIAFDDGHNTGLYDWDYLYSLGMNEQANWQQYLDELKARKLRRTFSDIPIKQL